ncbi:hypothetical protein, partial [Phocaeicola vulgatus]|uniref:hypothetical protein n=1 Tax=Phocaeicola vulgatus TaxID=821 RepID=UPI001EE08432
LTIYILLGVIFYLMGISFVLLSLLPGNTFSVGGKISCSIHTYQYPLIMNLTAEGKVLFLFLLFLYFVIKHMP